MPLKEVKVMKAAPKKTKAAAKMKTKKVVQKVPKVKKNDAASPSKSTKEMSDVTPPSKSTPFASLSSEKLIPEHPTTFASRSEMISALEKQRELQRQNRERQDDNEVRLKQENYVARLQETIERLRADKSRAEQRATLVEQKLLSKDRELQQHRRQELEGSTEDIVIARFAEMVAHEMAQESSSAKRKKTQKQMLACLAKDKFPAVKTATKLKAALQSARSWTS